MKALLLLSGLFIAASATGTELKQALPLTDRIVLLHFDEGYVVHHGIGQKRTDERVVIRPLDVTVAGSATSYRISSADDPAYRAARQPTKIARKAKGTEFAWFVDQWIDNRAVNTRPDHTIEHWVYLTLPRPMQPGKTYRIAAPALKVDAKLLFDVGKTRSEAVHVNLVGYAPRAPQKFGYVYHWMGDGGPLDLAAYAGKRWRVLNTATGRVALEGKLAFRAKRDLQETFHISDSPPHGNFLGADVYEADFSALRTPGTYRLAVDGVGASFPFEVSEDIYRTPFQMVTRALYHNRSGIALRRPYTEFERPAPHNPLLTPGFAGRLKYTAVRMQEWGSEGGDKAKLEAGFRGSLDVWGWYQDAGDWDSYDSHMRAPTEMLLVYEMAPTNFRDGELNIPESGNGVPDILDEAAWLPRFGHRLRQALLKKGWGTGGIGLRVAGDAFGGDGEGVPSYRDVQRDWAISGEDALSTFRYAATAAQLAICLEIAKVKDPEGVDWKKEARESYAWAVKNSRPNEADRDRPHHAHAAAALFRLTGETTYRDDFALLTADITPTSQVWNESGYGPFLFALAPKGSGDAALDTRIRAAVLNTADEVAIRTLQRRALRWGGNFSFPMLVGQQTTPWVLEAAVGHTLTKGTEPKRAETYLAAIFTTADYFLGTNPQNMTWVTGLGPRHVTQVFHMDAWYNGKGKFHPGLIPYGPWRKEQEQGQGPWSQFWPYKTVYPGIDAWPGAERYFSNRCAPMESEFTVHQNLGPAAAIFGFLCAPKR